MKEFENEKEHEEALEKANAFLDAEANESVTDEENVDYEIEETEDNEEDNEETENNEEEYEFEDDEEDEEDNEENDDEQEAENKPQENEEVNDADTQQVPLKALTKERKKYQERIKALEEKARIAETLMSSTGLDANAIMQEIQRNEVEMYKSKGLDEATAMEIVTRNKKLQDLESQMKSLKYDNEFNDLKRNSFYKDIEMYKDDVINLAESKGLTLEQAYLLTVGPEKLARQKKEVEQIQKIKQRNKQKVKINADSNPRNLVKKIKLTKAEREVIKASGIDPKRYIKLRDSKGSIF